MGRRSSTETVVALFRAFREAQTWKQHELADSVGLSVRQLRERLRELQRHGVPLERHEEHPHVYWSLPPGWTPAGITLGTELFEDVVELLYRTPPAPLRDDTLATLLARAGWPTTPTEWIVHARPPRGEDAKLWRLARKATELRQVLRIDYASASSPRRSRLVSPCRVWKHRSAHLIALCHEADALRRFHFGRIRRAEIAEGEAYISADPAVLEEFLRESVDGFHVERPPVEIRFTVPVRNAAWVVDDLPDGLHARREGGSIVVTGHVTGLERVASYVASLAGLARDLSPELGDEVRRIGRRLTRSR